MTKRPESVLVVVYTADRRVLLLQRTDDASFWQSVTGALEHGEPPEDAAVRELREETGLVCPDLLDCHSNNCYPIREDWRHRYPAGVTHNKEHVFLAPFPSVQPVSLSAEHLQAVWVEAGQALAQLWSSTNRQAVIDYVLAGNSFKKTS